MTGRLNSIPPPCALPKVVPGPGLRHSNTAFVFTQLHPIVTDEAAQQSEKYQISEASGHLTFHTGRTVESPSLATCCQGVPHLYAIPPCYVDLCLIVLGTWDRPCRIRMHGYRIFQPGLNEICNPHDSQIAAVEEAVHSYGIDYSILTIAHRSRCAYYACGICLCC